MAAPGAAGPQLWEVVGGRDQGGILVRAGAELSSSAESQRLSTGARLEELELRGERLKFRRLSGTGPASGWVTTRLQGRELVVRATDERGAGEAPAAGPLVRYFDLLRGPVDAASARLGAEEPAPDASRLGAVLREYGVAGFEVVSVLRTELGRDKFFVTYKDPSGKEVQLFVGHAEGDGPTAAAEASIAAFMEVGKHCRPEFVSVTQFMRTRGGAYLHERHIVSPAHGPSDWGRGAKDRRMLAAAIGELHRASVQAFKNGLPKQVERDLVEDEVGLGVLDWGLGVDYSESGLMPFEVGRIKHILASLRMLDRPARIMELPKMVVHTDLQFKNLCRSLAPGCHAPVLVDVKLGHRASRIWDLYFILCGDDLCSLVPTDQQMTEDFISAIRHYEEVSEMPFDEEETFLLMNTIMIKAIFTSCYFGSFQAHLPGSKKKCKAAYNAMEWIIERKDYFRSIF